MNQNDASVQSSDVPAVELLLLIIKSSFHVIHVMAGSGLSEVVWKKLASKVK